MSGSSAAMLQCLLGLCVLFSSSWAAVLTADQHVPLMRRSPEKADVMHLSASGEMIRSPSKRTKVSPAILALRSGDEEKYVQMCNWDYVEGNANTDNCTDATHHEHILESQMCLEAASQMGIPTLGEFDNPGFNTPNDDFYHRPRGCYKGPCSKPGGSCLFFNAVPMWPIQGSITGTPVCKRPRLVNGTDNANGVDNTCPTDYTVIDDEDFCSEAADCLGYCEGDEFRIGERNRTQHDFYPQGCFIHPIEGCVYMNPSYSALDGTDWVPSRPSGMPICQIASPAGSSSLLTKSTR